MATEAQRKANRQNTQKSTGPRTAAGKGRSSKNATKHGFLARDAVLASEDPAQYDRCVQDFADNLAPRIALQVALVHQIADWRLGGSPVSRQASSPRPTSQPVVSSANTTPTRFSRAGSATINSWAGR